MNELTVRESLGERRFDAGDFPLSVGGEGNAIVLAGRPAVTEAYLGLHEDQLFIQPAEGAEVLHNGMPVRRSTWLNPGDVVNFGNARLRLVRSDGESVLEVEDGSSGNITAPPIVTPGSAADDDEDDEAPIDPIRFRTVAPATKRRGIHPVRWSVAAVTVLALGALWFVFTASSVRIATDPAEASVAISGVLPAFRLGERFLLRPGAYRVRAEHEGYRPGEMTIEVADAPDQQFSLSLEKLPGVLRIELPVNAAVQIDGRPAGKAPGDFELAPGVHRIALRADMYQPFSADVEVEGAGKTQVFAPELAPDWADVTVSSEPAGAEIAVGGEVLGKTPLTARVRSGDHPLELRLDGFKPWSTDIQVEAGRPLEIGPVKLGLPDGRLVLRSEPSGANVTVAGVYRGQTPLDLELRPEMTHSVVLTKAGYASASRDVRLEPGERRSLAVSLEGIFGEVAVRAQPADARVYVNGEEHGAANQTLRLVATTHEIEIRKPGYQPYKTSITPRPGLAQVIETTLLTPEQARAASIPKVIESPIGQQLLLMPTGRFVMGSPRREPGRRANEAQREVEFRRAFYVGVREVTNAEFRRFRSSHRSGFVGAHTLDLDNQPVVNLTWEDAAAFCNWLSEQEGLPPAYKRQGDSLVPVDPVPRGYRLLTDAEWEWVARYDGAQNQRRYPWGDALPVAPGSGNYADRSAEVIVQEVVPGYDDGFAVSAPVGKFPPNMLGLYDIGGNVAEWVHDYYTVTVDGSKLAVDPTGPAQGKQHVIRGSSWRHSSVTELRLSARDFGESGRPDVGFRIARYVE